MGSRNYRDLIVWQKSISLVVKVYALAQTFPKDEQFGLVSQMRRCAVSIPSNIAEGSKRGTNKDFRQFVLIAFGSGAELETHLEISKQLLYIKNQNLEEIEKELSEIMRMLNKLSDSLKTTN